MIELNGRFWGFGSIFLQGLIEGVHPALKTSAVLDGAVSAVVGHEILEGTRKGTLGGTASHLQIGYQGHCGEIWLFSLNDSEAGWALAEEFGGARLAEGVAA